MSDIEREIGSLFTRLGETARPKTKKRWWQRLIFRRRRPAITYHKVRPDIRELQVRKRSIEEQWMPQETKIDLQPVRQMLRSEAATALAMLQDTLIADPTAFDLQSRLLLKRQALHRAMDILDGKCTVEGQPLRFEEDSGELTKAFSTNVEDFRPKARIMPVADGLPNVEEQPDETGDGKASLRHVP